MLDKDLAELYAVETKVLNQAVKRNIERFPADFMFQLTTDETINSRSQSVTLKQGENIKYLPYAFTEHGILMLSSVLNSERATRINIEIMRVFVMYRNKLLADKAIAEKFKQIEDKLGKHDKSINRLLCDMFLMMYPEKQDIKRIGFRKE